MSSQLWTSAHIADATKGTATGDWTATGVSIDSRAIEPGDLFIAIKGENFDGHAYVAAAIEAGAAGALISARPEGLTDDAPVVECKDTFDGLYDLARAARDRCGAKITAITGSVGKTGVKETLAHVLGAQGRTHATTGNLNNHFGLPLTLARMPADTEYAVLEMGMNHAGELGPLSRLARPHVAIVTTIAPAHLAFFDSVASIAEAKAEIFEGFEDQDGGTAILNRDNAYFPMLAVAAWQAGAETVVSFGMHPEALCRALKARQGADHSVIEAVLREENVNYTVGIPGPHWVTNSLAVMAAVQALGADLTQAAASMETAAPPRGRGLRRRVKIPGGTIELIDDSYNASPVSVRAALTVLASSEPRDGGRKIAILGDMLELGDESPQLHAGLAGAINGNDVDLVFTSGPMMQNLFDAVDAPKQGAHAADSEALKSIVVDAVRTGDVVMVKGSWGSKMALIIDALMEYEGRQAAAGNG